ncbi:MAG: aldehyde dehydrogenase family protein [Bryobacteraceae bacterium]|nr:aldehyde dehydrogenase family protein [Bryobacteraceae bacterium]MDW8376851.1 aldehyde dehydrogenase family protein [Bryobacterales bacterium]
MMRIQKTISPVDGRVYVERELARGEQIEEALNKAVQAQAAWRKTPLEERMQICNRMVAWMEARAEQLGEELSWQMGRPVRYAANEIRRGFAERAHYMISIAPRALADLSTSPKAGFQRFIRREPVGVVFTLAPWNYPYLTSVNSIVPALLAGNAVILKHSAQTPLCAERYAEAFAAAGLPEGVFQYLHLSHKDAEGVISDSRISFVAFTGSVAGGRAVQKAACERFTGLGLELGGKDAAYVRNDANLEDAVENLVDGAMFNSGQSCCGIERIYVHRAVYAEFVERAVELTRRYVLGDPLKRETTLGPMVRTSAAEFVRSQIAEAVSLGATARIDPREFPADRPGTPYLAPQILTEVDHSMRVMWEESFGPVVGITPVASDEEAVARINDSRYGLTAAIWTTNLDAAIRLGDQVQVGTWFMNRCDYLDPELAWTGVKDSGRGCSLSILGYEQLTRPKSFHLRCGDL